MRHEKLLRSETHDEACLDFERQLREYWMMVLSLMIDSTPSCSQTASCSRILSAIVSGLIEMGLIHLTSWLYKTKTLPRHSICRQCFLTLHRLFSKCQTLCSLKFQLCPNRRLTSLVFLARGTRRTANDAFLVSVCLKAWV